MTLERLGDAYGPEGRLREGTSFNWEEEVQFEAMLDLLQPGDEAHRCGARRGQIVSAEVTTLPERVVRPDAAFCTPLVAECKGDEGKLFNLAIVSLAVIHATRRMGKPRCDTRGDAASGKPIFRCVACPRRDPGANRRGTWGWAGGLTIALPRAHACRR